MIACTGRDGSIGTFLPPYVYGLKFNLLDDQIVMEKELDEIKPSIVIHLGAMTNLKECQKFPEKAEAVNVLGTVKLFRACMNIGVRRFIFVSTSHVYDRPIGHEPISVTHPLNPRSVYGQTKKAAELELIETVNERFENSLLFKSSPQFEASNGIELIIIRVFSVLSPLLNPGFLLTGIHHRAKNKDFSPIPGLNFVRDFLSSEEVCEKLMFLAHLESSDFFSNQKNGVHCNNISNSNSSSKSSSKGSSNCSSNSSSRSGSRSNSNNRIYKNSIHYNIGKSSVSILNICSGQGTTIRSVVETVFKEYNLEGIPLVSAPVLDTDVTWLVGLPSF